MIGSGGLGNYKQQTHNLIERNHMKNAEIFAHLGDRYVTAKSVISVSPETQKEYIAYHENFNVEEYTEEDCLKKSDALLGQKISDEESRELLFALAHIATLPCIKLLEQYVTISSLGELKEWAMMGFEEAWLHHINEEMGDKRTLMMTGAGGEGDMLRYYVVVSSISDLTQDQKKTISDAYYAVATEIDVSIENIEYEKIMHSSRSCHHLI